MNPGAIISIGDAAKAAGLTVKTIRYYEEISLIPKAGRTNGGAHTGGNRVYTEADVGRLRFIHHARLFGLALADIRELLALADSKGCPGKQPEYREILGRQLREIDERVRHLLGLRTAIEALMAPARRSKDHPFKGHVGIRPDARTRAVATCLWTACLDT